MIQPFALIFGGTFTAKQIKTIKEVCTPFFRNAAEEKNLDQILKHNPRIQVICVIGKESQYPTVACSTYENRIRSVTYPSVDHFLKSLPLLVNVFVSASVRLRAYDKRNLVSVFTSSYNSKHCIHRPLASLLAQKYQNWEWVIYDDSDGDSNWKLLQSIKAKDPSRIRIYRSDGNSGIIGDVKQIASSLCRGDFLVEFDHDDELTPDALENLVKAAECYPDAGFFYSDYCFIHENHDNSEFIDGFALGYGGYRRQWSDQFDKWVNISTTVPVNCHTVRWLVGSPNHFRAWRATTFREMGGWCADFHVADDYEILARTFCHTDMVRIPRYSYTQYVNNNKNNFTYIRNAEIQKLWRAMARNQSDNIHDRLIELTGEDPVYHDWETNLPVPYKLTAHSVPQINKIFDPRDHDAKNPQMFAPEPLVLFVFVYDPKTSLDSGSGQALRRAVDQVRAQKYTNVELLIVSTEAINVVEPVMRRMIKDANNSREFVEFVKSRVSYWDFANKGRAYSYYSLVNYALKTVLTGRFVALLFDNDADDALPTNFVQDSMTWFDLRDDVHGITMEASPNFIYRAELHKDCGYLSPSNCDLQDLLTSHEATNFVSFSEVVLDA